MNRQNILMLFIGVLIGGALTFAADTAMNDYKMDGQDNSHDSMSQSKLSGLRGDDFDKAFLENMIVHHQGALDMAKLIEQNAKHDELKQLGRDILTAQSKEIDIMQTWQGDWGYKVVPKSH